MDGIHLLWLLYEWSPSATYTVLVAFIALALNPRVAFTIFAIATIVAIATY